MAGNIYGRVVGVIAGSLGAIGALLSIGGAYPWWSLGVFALCVYVVQGLLVYGQDEKAADPENSVVGARLCGTTPTSACLLNPQPLRACVWRL